MRAAVYHRVSTLDQDPELARDELRGFCARIGAEITLDVEETASGALNSRPGLQRVLKAAARGKVDVVVVWKLDRFGRSSLDLLTNIRALTDAGCRFVTTSQGLDIKPGGDAISTLLLTVLAGVAEFERELIRERTRMGLDRARKRGVQLGRPTKAIDWDRVHALRAEGLSWKRIGAELGEPEATIRQGYVRRMRT